MTSQSNGVERAGWVIFLLLVLNVLNIVDRNLIISFAPQITRELNLTDFQFGLLTGLLFVSFYAVMGVFVGRLADRMSRTRLIAGGLALWSLLTVVSGATRNFVQIGTARMFIGVGEACLTPAAMSMIGDLYPAKKRGAMASLYYLGIPLGAGVSFVLAGVLGPLIGWRNCFYLLGALGLVLVPIVLWVREPVRGVFDEVVADPMKDTGLWQSCQRVWALCKRSPTLSYAMLGAIFLHLPISAGSFAMLWLVRERGFAEAEIQVLYGILLFVFGALGSIVSGYLSDWYRARFAGGRLRFLAYFLIAITPLLIGYRFVSPDSMLFYVAMSAGFVSFMAFYGPVFSTVQDITPPNMRGLTTAVLLLVSNLIGIGLGAVIVGTLSAVFSGMGWSQPLTWSLFAVDLLSAFTILWFWLGSVHYEREYGHLRTSSLVAHAD